MGEVGEVFVCGARSPVLHLVTTWIRNNIVSYNVCPATTHVSGVGAGVVTLSEVWSCITVLYEVEVEPSAKI
jgi:hypothetical protein